MKSGNRRYQHPQQIMAFFENVPAMLRKMHGHFYLVAPYQEIFCPICRTPRTVWKNNEE